MTYEKDIPEYALQPAKAPKTVPAEAIYHTQKITYPAEEQTVTYEFEEDILVPDTKPDMREILLMDAGCDIMPTEKKVSPKTDDLLNITGTLTIQTIYAAESEEKEPISITSKVPYKYQWSLNPIAQAEGVFGCQVKNLDYMIVNERKFRVKITLEFTGQLFCQREFQFFDGLKDESLETKRTQVSMTCLELTKKDEVTIDETFKGKDSSLRPEYILKQDFAITENYRQVTTEKVVINGFIFCSLLYCAQSEEEGSGSVICQHNQRIEFTQFVAIDKEQRGKNWTAVKTSFSGKNLTVSIDRGEEGEDEAQFRIKGDVQTRVELYEMRQKDIIVDAYHLDKNFQFQKAKEQVSNLAGEAMAETEVREIISLPEGIKAAETVYCTGTVQECSCSLERGRIIATGSIACCALWKDQGGDYRSTKVIADFRGTMDMEKAQVTQKASCRPVVKSAWVELINEKQIEINCTVSLCAALYDDDEMALLNQPCFMEKSAEKQYPMVIVTLKKDETLWDLAKRYKTTQAHIRDANQLEEEPTEGKRLLIIK